MQSPASFFGLVENAAYLPISEYAIVLHLHVSITYESTAFPPPLSTVTLSTYLSLPL
jgi:uncharacterized membrane protein (DUF2068 family)